ncbi:MAG: hypothetical protein F4Z43_00810 [Rhodothermaceae bacterium]|nr:hypothetical protein [Rhodothermaceae bacterium]
MIGTTAIIAGERGRIGDPGGAAVFHVPEYVVVLNVYGDILHVSACDRHARPRGGYRGLAAPWAGDCAKVDGGAA